MHIRKQQMYFFWTLFSYEWRKFDFWGHFHHYKHHKLHHYCYMHNFVYQYCHLGSLGKTRSPLENLFPPPFSPSHVSDQSYFLLLGGRPQVTRMPEWHFLFWLTSSLCIGVWNLSNNSCCPWQQVTVNLQSIEKGKNCKIQFYRSKTKWLFSCSQVFIFLSTTLFDLFALDHDPWCAESNRQTSRHARNTIHISPSLSDSHSVSAKLDKEKLLWKCVTLSSSMWPVWQAWLWQSWIHLVACPSPSSPPHHPWRHSEIINRTLELKTA